MAGTEESVFFQSSWFLRSSGSKRAYSLRCPVSPSLPLLRAGLCRHKEIELESPSRFYDVLHCSYQGNHGLFSVAFVRRWLRCFRKTVAGSDHRIWAAVAAVVAAATTMA
jgi:hypothetical protein